jgi:hypothetical protein
MLTKDNKAEWLKGWTTGARHVQDWNGPTPVHALLYAWNMTKHRVWPSAFGSGYIAALSAAVGGI